MFRLLSLPLILLAYIFVLKPARKNIFEAMQPTWLLEKAESLGRITDLSISGNSLQFNWVFSEMQLQLFFNMPFSFIFVTAIMVSVLFNAPKSVYVYVTLVNFIGAMLAYFFLVFGLWGWTSFFLISNLFNSYLVPVVTLVIALPNLHKIKTKFSRERNPE